MIYVYMKIIIFVVVSVLIFYMFYNKFGSLLSSSLITNIFVLFVILVFNPFQGLTQKNTNGKNINNSIFNKIVNKTVYKENYEGNLLEEEKFIFVLNEERIVLNTTQSVKYIKVSDEIPYLIFEKKIRW